LAPSDFHLFPTLKEFWGSRRFKSDDEMKDGEVKDDEVKDDEVKDGEVKDDEVKDDEVKDAIKGW
jgi:hypothetical protein